MNEWDEFTTEELKDWLAGILSDTLDNDATDSEPDDDLTYDIMAEIYRREDISDLELHAIEFYWQYVKFASATNK